jgi:AcrR family transcriptional regulator
VTTAVGGSRRDAQRNHARLRAAAREAFGELGTEATLEEIARRAGLGIGTLYRHFPTRADLLAAVFADEAARWHEAVRRALVTADAREGLRHYFVELSELHARYGALQPVLAEREEAAEAQGEMRRLTEELLLRAKREGALREDFELADLAMLLWSLTHLLELTAADAPSSWQRHLDFVLDGLRPAAASASALPALSEDELIAVSQKLAAR